MARSTKDQKPLSRPTARRAARKRETLLVAAPRHEPYLETEKQSRIVIWHRRALHPANPAYRSPAGEVCICEGDGVAGDPAGRPHPWGVYPYPEILELVGQERLVEVEPGQDTSDLKLDDNDLCSLGLSEEQIKQLAGKGVSDVADLVTRLEAAEDPIEWLGDVHGIGEAKALVVYERLSVRDAVVPIIA